MLKFEKEFARAMGFRDMQNLPISHIYFQEFWHFFEEWDDLRQKMRSPGEEDNGE